MNRFTTKHLYLLLVFLSLGMTGRSSHIVGGYIETSCVGPNQYAVSLTIYEDCGSAFIGSWDQEVNITNDCGFSSPTSAWLPYESTTSGAMACPSAVGQCFSYRHTWTDTITLPGDCDSWVFSYDGCCLGTTYNLFAQPNFYWEYELPSTSAGCSNSAYPTNSITPAICAGDSTTFNFGFYDPDGDSLGFELISAQEDAVTNTAYDAPYTGAQPMSGIYLDSLTGDITLPPSTSYGAYHLVVQVSEYRNGTLVGVQKYNTRVNVLNCSNEYPTASGIQSASGVFQYDSSSVIACGGDTTCIDLTFADSDLGDSLKIDHNLDQLFQGVVVSRTGANPAMLTICIPPQPGMSGVHHLEVSASDGNCSFEGTVVFPFRYEIGTEALNAGPDQTLCGGNTITLNPSGNQNVSWSVLSGDPINVGSNFSCNPCSSPVVDPAVTTVYVGEIIDICGNVYTDTITIGVGSSVEITMPDTLIQCGLFEVIPSTSLPVTSHTWSDTSGNWISDLSSLPNDSLPYGAMDVVLEVQAGGCFDLDTIFMSNFLREVDLSADQPELCAGGSTAIQLNSVYPDTIFDDFNDCANPTFWTSISGGTCTSSSLCQPSPTGDNYYYMSGTSTGLRELVTQTLNTTPCSTIDLCLYVANDISMSFSCDDNEPMDSICLEYSVDGGASWDLMTYFDESWWDAGGSYPDSWNCFSLTIPSAAQGYAVQFRLIQKTHGNGDQWAVDNFGLACSHDQPFGYSWFGANIQDTSGYVTQVDSATIGTTYVEVYDSLAGCGTVDSIIIATAPPLVSDIYVNDDSVCVGNSISVYGYPDQWQCPDCIYEWSGSSYNNPMNQSTATAISAGDSIMIYMEDTAKGCVGRDTVILAIDDISINLLAMPDSICLGDTGLVFAGFNGLQPLNTYSFNWTMINSNGTINMISDTLVEVYDLTSTDDVRLTVNSDPAFGCSTLQNISVYAKIPDTSGAGVINGPSTALELTTVNYSGTYASHWTPTWDVQGGTINSGQGTNTISVTWGAVGQGTVTLYLTDSTDCYVDTLEIVVSIQPNGIAGQSVKGLQIYPNPATNQLTIEGLDKLNAEEPLQILDITGRQVLTIDPIADRVTVDVSSLETGMYTVVTADRASLTRFVVRR